MNLSRVTFLFSVLFIKKLIVWKFKIYQQLVFYP